MEQPRKESQDGARERTLEGPPKPLRHDIKELVYLAHCSINLARGTDVPEVERQRLLRAAAALLDTVMGELNHVSDRGWVPIGEAVRNVLREVKPHG